MAENHINDAFTTLPALPIEKEVLYLKSLPKDIRDWIIFDAPANFDARGAYNIYRKHGSDGLRITMVANAMHSAMLHYPGADRETIFAMLGPRTRNLVPRRGLELAYNHLKGAANAKTV